MITLEKIIKFGDRQTVYRVSAPTIDQAIEAIGKLIAAGPWFVDGKTFVPAELVTPNQPNGALKH